MEIFSILNKAFCVKSVTLTDGDILVYQGKLSKFPDAPAWIFTLYRRDDDLLKFDIHGGINKSAHVFDGLFALSDKQYGIEGVFPISLPPTLLWLVWTINNLSHIEMKPYELSRSLQNDILHGDVETNLKQIIPDWFTEYIRKEKVCDKTSTRVFPASELSLYDMFYVATWKAYRELNKGHEYMSSGDLPKCICEKWGLPLPEWKGKDKIPDDLDDLDIPDRHADVQRRRIATTIVAHVKNIFQTIENANHIEKIPVLKDSLLTKMIIELFEEEGYTCNMYDSLQITL